MTQYAASLRIDWGDKKHDPCLLDAATYKKRKQVWPQMRQAIAEYFTNVGRVIRETTNCRGPGTVAWSLVVCAIAV